MGDYQRNREVRETFNLMKDTLREVKQVADSRVAYCEREKRGLRDERKELKEEIRSLQQKIKELYSENYELQRRLATR